MELCRVSCVELEKETRYVYRYGARARAPAPNVSSFTADDLLQFMELPRSGIAVCTIILCQSILIHLSPMAVCTVCTAAVHTSNHLMYSKNQPNSLQVQHTSCVSAVIHQGNQPFSCCRHCSGAQPSIPVLLMPVPPFNAERRAQPLLWLLLPGDKMT